MSEKHWAEAWAVDLCSLLDEIEKAADDEGKVRDLLALRFDIARRHGLSVQRTGSGSTGNA